MTAADALATAYRHGPGRLVERGTTPRPEPTPGPRTPFAALAARGRFGSALAHLLTDVVTPLRWEPWNQYNDHRGHPSARAAFTVDVVLVVGSRRWLVDPVGRSTVGDDPPAPDGSVRLELVRRRDRLSEGYHEFGDVLTELELGHVAAALVEHAPRLGLRAHADGTAVVVSSDRETGRPAGPAPARSSGFGPRGISADPRPLPASALHAFIAAITHPPVGSPVRDDVRHRLAVRNVEGMADGWYALDGPQLNGPQLNGPQLNGPQLNGLQLVEAGAALDRVRAAFGHPPDTIDVGAMNLALVSTGDPAAAVAGDGPDGYRALLRAAGAAAQHACTAAAGAGMFCRPARSTVDGALEAAVRAPTSHVLLYLLLAGRPRGAGFSYDLTPLEAR